MSTRGLWVTGGHHFPKPLWGTLGRNWHFPGGSESFPCGSESFLWLVDKESACTWRPGLSLLGCEDLLRRKGCLLAFWPGEFYGLYSSRGCRAWHVLEWLSLLLWLSCKESACNADLSSHPWVGKWQCTPVFAWRILHGQRSLQATGHGIAGVENT